MIIQKGKTGFLYGFKEEKMTIRLFEVGGSIRDELMGIDNPPDRDFCAESPDGWEALLAWCHTSMKRVFLVTPEFFTIRGMMPNGTSIDVVMCRKDGPSSDGRHPDHVEPGSLLDDLARRDFTVNAMAREVNSKTLEPIGDIIDPFSGREDIKTLTLKCVGNTAERFREDGLRLLRAARFIITKNIIPNEEISHALETSDWWNWLKETVSIERIREEVHKMFVHDTPATMKFLSWNCSPTANKCIFSHGLWLKPTLENK